MLELNLLVTDTAGEHLPRPITSGVPLAEGTAPDGVGFLLHDEHGQAVPLQSRVLARWKDGSARWVLLDFSAAPPPHGQLRYRLTWAENAKSPTPAQPVDLNGSCLIAGRLTLTTADNALLMVSESVRVTMTVIDAQGERFDAATEEVTVEVAGPVRATLALRGSFRHADGRRWFSFRLRASCFTGFSRILLEPMILIDADEGLVQHLRELTVRVEPVTGVTGTVLGGSPGWTSDPKVATRLFQIDDQHYVIEGTDLAGEAAPGWAEIHAAAGPLTVSLRDFRQQWPKSLEADHGGLTIGLFPRYTAGEFTHMQPWYKHDYLFAEDCYRLRAGQSRRWHIWLDLEGDGVQAGQYANAPLVAAADPAQALATGAWGRLAPAGLPEMAEYDAWVEKLFGGYCDAIERERDYGAMNWGDWWGERGCNWGNHEYDTPRQILQQFARTGDPRYFYVGETAARHTAEVDVIHAINADLVRYFEEELPVRMPEYPIRPGMVHEHCVGHVGGFHPVEEIRALLVSLEVGKTDKPYLCLDPYNLGHIWTQGMMYAYFLTGDPWIKETLESIGDNLAQLVEDREYCYFKGDSHSGRVNGWTMLALAGVYEMDFDDRYLRAMQLLADDALEEQDPHCGGWLYELPWGHCFCANRKHVGEAGFLTSVRLNGLARYYDLTGDPRIPQALQRAVAHLNNDTWKEEHASWRYTSCPASAIIDQPGVTIMALAHSVRLTGDAEQRRILHKAWEAKFARLQQTTLAGKAFSSSIYGCPETIGIIVEREVPEERTV